MKVVILCGGKGTRLREHTESIPKVLIDIGGRPILWHIMKIYSAYGFNDFILCLGHKGHMIKEYFMDYHWRNNDFSIDLRDRKNLKMAMHDREPEPWKIIFAETGDDTNTGGRITRVASYIKEESFLVTYGDGVADIHLGELLAFHKAHAKIGTITAVKPSLQFGILDLNGSHQVLAFHEKPTLDHWINGGFFVFNRDFFRYLKEDDILEQEPLEQLARDGQLMAYRHDSYWKCMDTYKDTVVLNELWQSGKAPWKKW